MNSVKKFLFLKAFTVIIICVSSSHFCVPPAPPYNGKVNLGRGDVVIRYSCDKGHKLVGTPVAVCVSGKWSSETPECRPISDVGGRIMEHGNSTDLVLKDQQIFTIYKDNEIVKNFDLESEKKTKKKHEDKKKKKRKNQKKNNRKNKEKLKTKNKELTPIVNGIVNVPPPPPTIPQESRKNEVEATENLNKNEKRKLRKEKKRRKEERKKGEKRRKEKANKEKGLIKEPVEKAIQLTTPATLLNTYPNLTTNVIEKKKKNERNGRNMNKARKNEGNAEELRKKEQKVVENNSILIPLEGRKRKKRKRKKQLHATTTTVTPFFVTVPTTTVALPPRQSPTTTTAQPTVEVDEVIDNFIYLGSEYESNPAKPTKKPKQLKGPSTSSTSGSPSATSRHIPVTPTPLYSSLSPVSIEKNKDFLQDIIKRLRNPDKIATNIIDSITPKSADVEEVERKKAEGENPNEFEKVLKSKKSETQTLDNNINVDEDDYDNIISAYDDDYDSLPKGYPGSSYKSDNEAAPKEDDGPTEVDRRFPEGYPAPDKRLYEVDEVNAAKERFLETDNIEFNDLDTSCIISELDSSYLPPPRVPHGHVTSYTTVTNPAPPNNVYVEAIYECDFGHQLNEITSNRLFCQKNKWLGILPECLTYETKDGLCGPDNGGCQQICQKIGEPDDVTCSCYRGFTLDSDKKSCVDVDECLINNGGCGGACFNKHGSHMCYCPKGYRLATNGKTCVDKNECILRNGHGPCQDTCHNTEGDYYCTCDGILGTSLAADNHTCEDVDECALNNGNCSHICLNTFGQIFCSCPDGFYLGMDWKNCIDFNECDYPEVAKKCKYGCINTPGSYHCAELQEFNSKLECSSGLKPTKNEEGCEDINECMDENFGCSHMCINTHGSAHCDCPNGYLMSEDGKVCKDIDECKTSSAPCSHICINTEGSFFCRCSLGMSLGPDLRSCIDINECSTDNGMCSHNCINKIGSYICGCPNGFALEDDDLTCLDIDECETENGQCDQVCSNSEGSFQCLCTNGYELLNDHHCGDINECALPDVKCDHKCHNLEGSFECLCHEGYSLLSDNATCDDIDECQDGNGCSHICSNANGSYICSCPTGMILLHDNHTCEDINECERNNGGCSDLCLNMLGGYECSCSEGSTLIPEGTTFEMKHICIDVDECAINNRICSHICENIEGGYTCKCPIGYLTVEKEQNVTCIDIDECLENNGGCSHICVNLLSTFECQCPRGYELKSDKVTCEDVDECLKENGGCSHECINQPGSFECTCPPGWDIDYNYDYANEATYIEGLAEPWKTCTDIDECEKNGIVCSHDCVNEAGSFHCKCPQGFTLIDEFTCKDIDECLVEKGGCSHSCSNTEGSFKCFCPEGFSLVDSTRCLDIDECSRDNGNCSHFCKNDMGSYHCSCPHGYLLEVDNVTCSDVNECGEFNGGCSHECQNSDGLYKCFCPPGMELSSDEHICHDVDECKHNNGGCSSICLNTVGSFKCSCPSGLDLAVDGKTCVDVDECGLNNGGCSHHCSNSEGHYLCLCPSGMTLANDSHSCVDIDECTIKNGGCSSDCLNSVGSFSCLCPSGTELGSDKKTCHDVNECLLSNGGCSGLCHNIRGSYRCECAAGFQLRVDKLTCIDLNECNIANGGCSHSCKNTLGSFICECPVGYSLNEDGYRCLDVDECESNPCEHDCQNTLGSFYCKCQKGFKPKPDAANRCWDVNECETENGRCAHKCFNTIGSYICGCDDGFTLSEDGHSCDAKPVFCPLITSPLGGNMKCSEDLQGDSYPKGTLCIFSCNEGNILRGQPNATCTAKGKWTNDFVTCQAVKCPAISEVEHGRISPTHCTKGASAVGHHCYLSCSPGYRVMGNPVRTCTISGSWSPEAPSPFCEKDSLKPFIQCPNDATVDLPPQQSSAYVRLPKPKSNVDWFRVPGPDQLRNEETNSRFVEASPEWAKNLEADLPAGRTTITFVAKSPLSDARTSCSFVVYVRDQESPQVFGCPKSSHVQLGQGEASLEVSWNEPIFKDNVEVAHIYKSMEPGRHLTSGTYPVHYVAVDAQGNRAKCSFVVTVEAALPVQRLFQSNRVWVACPGLNGGRPTQMYVWLVPQDCTVTSPSNSAHHVQWDSTHTHLEAPSASNAAGREQPPKMEPTREVSVYDALAISQGSSSHNKQSRDGDLSSSTAFATNHHSGGDHNNDASKLLNRHHQSLQSFYGGDSSPFNHLLHGSQSFALAHARAGSGRNGGNVGSAFAHAQSNNENTRAMAHARSRVFNYG